MKADQRAKGYAVAALGLECAALTLAFVAAVLRGVNENLTDLSTLAAGAGLVLVGMALGRLEVMNLDRRSS